MRFVPLLLLPILAIAADPAWAARFEDAGGRRVAVLAVGGAEHRLVAVRLPDGLEAWLSLAPIDAAVAQALGVQAEAGTPTRFGDAEAYELILALGSHVIGWRVALPERQTGVLGGYTGRAWTSSPYTGPVPEDGGDQEALIRPFAGHTRLVLGPAWSAEEQTEAGGNELGERNNDASAGAPVPALTAVEAGGVRMALTERLPLLVLLTPSNRVAPPPATDRPRLQVAEGVVGNPMAVLTAPGGRHALVRDDGVAVWDLASGWPVRRFSDGFAFLAWLPDGRTFVGSAGGELTAYDAATGARRWRLQLGVPGRDRNLNAYVEDLRADGHGRIHVRWDGYDVVSPDGRHLLKRLQLPMCALAADNRSAWTFSRHETEERLVLVRHDLAAGATRQFELPAALADGSLAISGMALSPDGSRLAIAAGLRAMLLIDTATGAEARVWRDEAAGEPDWAQVWWEDGAVLCREGERLRRQPIAAAQMTGALLLTGLRSCDPDRRRAIAAPEAVAAVSSALPGWRVHALAAALVEDHAEGDLTDDGAAWVAPDEGRSLAMFDPRTGARLRRLDAAVPECVAVRPGTGATVDLWYHNEAGRYIRRTIDLATMRVIASLEEEPSREDAAELERGSELAPGLVLDGGLVQRTAGGSRRLGQLLDAGGMVTGALPLAEGWLVRQQWLLSRWTAAGPQEGHPMPQYTLAMASGSDRLWTSAGPGLPGVATLWGTRPTLRPLLHVVVDAQGALVAFTPQGAYFAERGAARHIGFAHGLDAYPAEQFDLALNRPDEILAIAGHAHEGVVAGYRALRQRRLAALGARAPAGPEAIGDLPTVALQRDRLPLSTAASEIQLAIAAIGVRAPLARLHVLVGGVPLDGRAGRAIAGRDWSGTLTVPLLRGENRISVQAVDAEGRESLLASASVASTAPERLGQLHVVAIGVGAYPDPEMRLAYAAKDARDLANAFATRSAAFAKVHQHLLVDGEVVRERLGAVRSALLASAPEDRVVLYLAGHGVLDAGLEYWFAPVDMDFAHPERRGIRYQEIEDLLDGIPARTRAVFIDTCHSGGFADAAPGPVEALPAAADPRLRTRGLRRLAGGGTAFAFLDLRRSPGASVLASAAGSELALESPEWSNGVFTMALIEGLAGAADADADGVISIADLHRHAAARVAGLTGGAQTPTVRAENRSADLVLAMPPPAPPSAAATRRGLPPRSRAAWRCWREESRIALDQAALADTPAAWTAWLERWATDVPNDAEDDADRAWAQARAAGRPRPAPQALAATRPRPAWATAHGADARGDWADLDLGKGTMLRLRWVPGGEQRRNDRPEAVAVPAAWVAESEVTVAQWNGRATDRLPGDPSLPAMVGLAAAQAWIARLPGARLPDHQMWWQAAATDPDIRPDRTRANCALAADGVGGGVRTFPLLPPGLYPPNRHGLRDLDGNAPEWILPRDTNQDGERSMGWRADQLLEGGLSWTYRCTQAAIRPWLPDGG